MTLPDLANFSPDELDNFAQNNFMIYNWAMPPEDFEMIIKKFEQVVKYDKTQVDEFKTGRKNFTEIDIDKYGDSDFWKEPKKKLNSTSSQITDFASTDTCIFVFGFPVTF